MIFYLDLFVSPFGQVMLTVYILLKRAVHWLQLSVESWMSFPTPKIVSPVVCNVMLRIYNACTSNQSSLGGLLLSSRSKKVSFEFRSEREERDSKFDIMGESSKYVHFISVFCMRNCIWCYNQVHSYWWISFVIDIICNPTQCNSVAVFWLPNRNAEVLGSVPTCLRSTYSELNKPFGVGKLL